MRAVVLFMLLITTVYGYQYNELLIRAQSEIFPKLLLLDKKLDEKLVEGKVLYGIVYDKGDETVAARVRDEITRQHKAHLEAYPFEVRLVHFSEVDALDLTAVYVLNLGEHVEKVAKRAMESGIIAFSYDVNDLENGVLISLMVERFTVLYLNKSRLKDYPVDFVDALYRIVRFRDLE